MKLITVKAKDTNDRSRVVFDHADAGIVNGKAARVVIRADGKAKAVNGALKVIKDALDRGDLVLVDGEMEADEKDTAAPPVAPKR
jgi:hypothetical protein